MLIFPLIIDILIWKLIFSLWFASITYSEESLMLFPAKIDDELKTKYFSWVALSGTARAQFTLQTDHTTLDNIYLGSHGNRLRMRRSLVIQK